MELVDVHLVANASIANTTVAMKAASLLVAVVIKKKDIFELHNY